MSSQSLIPSELEIIEAHQRIEPFVEKTRLIHSQALDKLLGCEVWLKCENEQKAKAFKTRGAFNAVLQLSDTQLAKGLVTHSSGNHAQSLAFAGKERRAKTFVVMPNTAPEIKVKKVRDLGAQITFCENTPEARQAAADEIVNTFGATFIHPFDNHHVICGQATVAKEIVEEDSSFDILIAPVGGGGLLSGTGLSAQYFGHNIKVYAAEPEGAADAIKSFKTGKVEKADYVNTLADGLQTYLSARTLHIIQKTVSDVLIAKESSIPKAMKLIYDHFNILIETSSAVTLALILDHPELFKNKKIALILTGGNIDKVKAIQLMNE